MEHIPEQTATVITDPDDIAFYRLASLKGALKLESKGITMSAKTGKLRPKLAAEFGLKPRDSYEKFIAAVQAKMDELMAQRQAALAAELNAGHSAQAELAMMEKEVQRPTLH